MDIWLPVLFAIQLRFADSTRRHSTGLKSPTWQTLDGTPPMLLAHRGEKVLMPENTIGSYEMAAALGADYIEMDLVLTKDGQLVCSHDITLGSNTNVKDFPEFMSRRRNFTGLLESIPTTILNDWFIQDFTIAELQRLRVRQEDVGIRLQYFNDLFHIPSFEDALRTVHKMAYKLGYPVGIVPELKHPTFSNTPWHTIDPYFMESKFLKTLKKFGYPIRRGDKSACHHEKAKIPCGHLIIQCFDEMSIKYLKQKTTADLMMLVEFETLKLTNHGLRDISKFATYVGFWKEHLYVGPEAVLNHKQTNYNVTHVENSGGFLLPKSLVEDAHELKLKVAIFTIYDSREMSSRGCAVMCEVHDKEEELHYYFRMGVDAIFVENMVEAVKIRCNFEKEYHL